MCPMGSRLPHGVTDSRFETVVRETSVPLGDHEEMAYGIALSGWSEEKRRRWEDWIRQLELRLVREQLGEVESPDDEKAS